MSTDNCMARGELGRTSLECVIKQRMLNFWTGLVTGKKDKIAHNIYKILRSEQTDQGYNSEWLNCIKSTLDSSGLGSTLNEDPSYINPVRKKHVFKDRILSIEKQNWSAKISESGRCRSYSIYKKTLDFETYLTNLNKREATDLCRFRCSNHHLPVVAGRYNNIEREQRKCALCNHDEIGDEFHYLFICEAFNKERAIFINQGYTSHPNSMLMERLFNSQDPKVLSNLAKFCRIIMASFKSTVHSKAKSGTRTCNDTNNKPLPKKKKSRTQILKFSKASQLKDKVAKKRIVKKQQKPAN